MSDDSTIIPRDLGSNKPVEILSPGSPRIPAIELSPREPHLYDYLLILRKAPVADSFVSAGGGHLCEHRDFSDEADLCCQRKAGD